jgi:carbon-monoxide dehydrogenase medium subunit
MLALGARFVLRGETVREVDADDFFLGMFSTLLDPGEILTAISFPETPFSAYRKFPHPASGYAVVGVAASVTVEEGRIARARVAVTGVADMHFRARALEDRLEGIAIDDRRALEAACVGTASEVSARGDGFASAEYRSAMADVYANRAVSDALARAAFTP